MQLYSGLCVKGLDVAHCIWACVRVRLHSDSTTHTHTHSVDLRTPPSVWVFIVHHLREAGESPSRVLCQLRFYLDFSACQLERIQSATIKKKKTDKRQTCVLTHYYLRSSSDSQLTSHSLSSRHPYRYPSSPSRPAFLYCTVTSHFLYRSAFLLSIHSQSQSSCLVVIANIPNAFINL